MNKEEEDKLEFFIKVREKFEDIEDLADHYGVKDDFMALMCVGLIEDDISVSRKNVLRGMHGDSKTKKFIQCLHGRGDA